MAKHYFKRWTPSLDALEKSRVFRTFAPFLTDPRLWHFNRRSVALATYFGVFFAFVPLPVQMPLAIAFALIFRANLPLSIAWTWISNPVTFLPILYSAYRLGATLLQQPMVSIRELTAFVREISSWAFSFGQHGITLIPQFSLKALLLGLAIEAVVASLLVGTIVHWFWRWHVKNLWRKRAIRLSQLADEQEAQSSKDQSS